MTSCRRTWLGFMTFMLLPHALLAQKPADLLKRAIVAAGGSSALTEYRTFNWTARAVVHVPGRDVVIRGTWKVTPPDSATVATYDTARGPTTTRTLIVAGDQGWMKRDTSMTPLPEDLLAEERHQYYLYSLLRLVTLKEKGVKLRPVFPDSSGNHGFVVERANRLPVTMYFDSAGRVVRLITTFALPGPVAGDAQEVRMSGTVVSNGVKWFEKMEIRRDGKPYYEMSVEALEVRR